MAAIQKHHLSEYRPDIDGLRAVAVVVVLLFHFFPGHFKGGFVGVDVFFVISGYLVTGILYANMRTGGFSFKTFYSKRVRRLFPSLILTLLCTLLAGWFLLLSAEFLSLGKHVFSSSVFFSNAILFSESGYFDRSSDLKPLLHLWSLGLEEQFYIVWPLLILGVFRWRKEFLPHVLGIICAVSLILNVVVTGNNQAFSFYLLPARLWELAGGGMLIFLNPNHPASSVGGLEPVRKWIALFVEWLQKMKIDMACIGALLIAFACYILDKDKCFPGWWVILPVLGTMAIILSGPRGVVNRFLSAKWMVYVGLISYPLYLWHWPLVSFANIITSGTSSTAVRGGLLFLSFALAVLSYEYAEKPVRKMGAACLVDGILFSSLFVVGGLGLFVWKYGGVPSRYPQTEMTLKSKSSYLEVNGRDGGKSCEHIITKMEICMLAHEEREPTIALVGDSHALHLYPGLREVYDRKGENLLLLAKSGTPPLYNVVSKRSPDSTLDDVFDYVRRTPAIHTVVLSSFWGNYFEQNGVQVSNFKYKNVIEDLLDSRQADQAAVFSRSFSRTVEYVAKTGKRLIIFYDVPSLHFHLDGCLPRPFVSHLSDCSFSVASTLKEQQGYREAIQHVLERDVAASLTDGSRVRVIDPVPYLCPQDKCSVIRDGIILYSDDFHLSNAGSLMVIDKIPNL